MVLDFPLINVAMSGHTLWLNTQAGDELVCMGGAQECNSAATAARAYARAGDPAREHLLLLIVNVIQL